MVWVHRYFSRQVVVVDNKDLPRVSYSSLIPTTDQVYDHA